MVCTYRWDALNQGLSNCSEEMSGADGSFSLIFVTIAGQIMLICGLIVHIFFTHVKLKKYQYISPISRDQNQNVQLLRSNSEESSCDMIDAGGKEGEREGYKIPFTHKYKREYR